ncbi:succinate dehydrogenase iron-sulfur subunit [Blochmannia endosymbiont of Camponotus sp. C-003]|uniref:succinate dehydrogenase iron-sulfur subunit n=1 Tax=unclassified Candidatus Blochmanniella TaxID=711328 RepID=UPI00202563D6|nr:MULTISPECIES: succinate dehydrogenase iron-sulfur subunit [unclassified Candidatus Blochmannia]URJ23482.1 succinate dehydrogenase iron-sulfur subunit [Blochmannia endosymbiont of Camponotus sp. C-003]URJ28954.1 succinate dehydrogenase iron-sulfur subunit [Blochmannia endosymbiont of Camponotus sp. C-046]
MQIKFSIYRYNPEMSKNAYMKHYTLNLLYVKNMTLLDALIKLKEQDSTLTFRRSCREGVCGSDGMNINGVNNLACITSLKRLYDSNHQNAIVIRPLSGFPIIRDLVVDMSQFFLQYERIQPFLINNHSDQQSQLLHEHLQSPEERSKLDGSYECILCACCSSSCPSFWWNPDKFIGPAGLLTLYRFLMDSRDTNDKERLQLLKDSFSIFRCHNIMNCVNVCPKKLNPAKAIGHIKRILAKNLIGIHNI